LLDEYTTVIIVSHDIPATSAISDTIWLMGRDRDAQGNVTSGAKIKYTFDLMQRNLAWQSDIRSLPAFHQLMDEVRGLFRTL
jgi:ABC-type nitrate/sulfonate/bicarbonate transport system ATPase subunit